MKLPKISAKQMLKVLEQQGFKQVRQKGSHIVLKKKSETSSATVVVPNHSSIAIGTLHSILRKSGITKELLIKMLTILLAGGLGT